MTAPTSLDQLCLTGLAPKIAANTRLLILGSFPGVASLAKQQYYAHPRNLFWPFLAQILQINLLQMPYEERWPHVLAAGIGVWDVYRACVRPGSLDSDIRAGQANDFASLLTTCPQLRCAALNGRTAAKFVPQLQALGWQTVILPSTSPANAGMREADKLAVWRAALAPGLPGASV